MDQLRIPPPDETGNIVQMRFQEFLQSFRIPYETEEMTQQRFSATSNQFIYFTYIFPIRLIDTWMTICCRLIR